MTRPPTGSHKNLVAKNTLITSDADAVRSQIPRKACNDRGGGLPLRQERLHSAPAEDPEPPVGKPFVTTIEGAIAVAPLVTSGNASARRRRVPSKTIRLSDNELCKFVRTHSHALCAGRAPTEAHHISLALSPVLSPERSAMNTQSRSAGCTTGICTVTAMRPHGGPGSASIPCRSRSNFGGNLD